MDKPIVLDVGQCDADHGSIRRLVEQIGGRVIRAHHAEDALHLVSSQPVRLVLVNRILDADGADGVKLIGELMSRIPQDASVVLVSNYPEYQEKAVALGAAQGFGKAALHQQEIRARIAELLGL